MIVRACRITNARHADNAFDGKGAEKNAGRWNSIGTPVVYTAQSISLAMLETLVHLDDVGMLSHSYTIFEVSFDDSLIQQQDVASLPKDWRISPVPKTVQNIGDKWVQTESSPVLAVPSTIVPSEWNYLLNPRHPAFGSIEIGPATSIRFDPRLIKTNLP